MIRTIKGAYEKIKELDPATDVTLYAIRKIVKENKIPYIRSGKKYLINVETLIEYLKGDKK